MHTFLQASHFLPPTRFGFCLRYIQEIIDCFGTILCKNTVILESINANVILMRWKNILILGLTNPFVALRQIIRVRVAHRWPKCIDSEVV